MKINVLILTLFTSAFGFAQKKMSYKIDEVAYSTNYNYLPEIPAASKYATYALEVTSTKGEKFNAVKLNVPGQIVSGKNLIASSKDLQITIAVKNVTFTDQKVVNVPQVKDVNGAVTSESSSYFEMYYNFNYHVIATDVATNAVILDSVFSGSDFVKYPQDFGSAAPKTESALKSQLGKDIEINGQELQYKKEVAAMKHDLANMLGKKITSKLGTKSDFAYFKMMKVKTKDPVFEELNLALDNLEALLKEYKKMDSKMNFHLAAFNDKAMAIVPIIEKFAGAEFASKLDPEDQKEYNQRMNFALFNIYLLTNDYKKAAQPFEMIMKGKIAQQNEDAKNANAASNEKEASLAALRSLKLTIEEEIFQQSAIMRGIYLSEVTAYDAKKAFYGYER